MMGRVLKVVSYFRYSTDNKLQVENSEARQRDSVERICYRNKWQIVDSFTDHAVSGTDDKPELLKLKDKVESAELVVDIIAVDDLSRLSRRTARKIDMDIDWIEKAGILLSIASRNNGEPFPVSELDDDLSLIVGNWQNNQYVKKLSSVVSKGMKTKFERGELGWVGKAPYGYDLRRSLDNPSTLIANKDLPLVKRMFKHVLDGGSLRSCVSFLEKTEQFKNGKGKAVGYSSVKNVLRSSIYCGIRTFGVRAVGKHSTVASHNKNWVTQNPLVQADSYQEYDADGYEAIISVDEFNQVQAILDENQSKRKKFPERQRYLYSGVLRCWNCGTALNASTYTDKKTNEKMIRYVCPSSANGGSLCKEEDKPHRKQIRTDEIEPMIARKFGTLLMNKSFHYDNLMRLVEKLIKRSKSSIKSVEEDFAIQDKRLEELTDLYLSTGNESLKEKINEQAGKLDALKKKADESLERDDLLEYAKSQYESFDKGAGLNKYYGFLYELAIRIAVLQTKKERVAQGQIAAELIRNHCIEAVAEIAAKIEHLRGEKAGQDIVEGFQIAGSPDAQIAILTSMGLDYIKVGFELGLFRGKPRRVPTELAFAFSVASANSTDKD